MLELLKWFYPGMRVKRWLFLALCGLLLAALGVDLIMEGNLFGYLARPIHNLEFRSLTRAPPGSRRFPACHWTVRDSLGAPEGLSLRGRCAGPGT